MPKYKIELIQKYYALIDAPTKDEALRILEQTRSNIMMLGDMTMDLDTIEIVNGQDNQK